MSEGGDQKMNEVRVAVEGCGHGTLHAIYASVEHACQVKGWEGVDLLIIGGDFQAVRNQYDLNVTAMPPKYRKMADFHEYYSGTRTAPYLTVFIGGNHEASNHLFELYYGGWVAPNIYYLGAANVLNFGPLRIAGLSGIWKGYDYRKPHFERLPYNQEDMTSIFHVRELDMRKLLSLRSQVDIGLSHDWPQGVEYHGDYNWLFNKKPDFGTDSYAGKLGSVAARQCLDRLRPRYWFSAHLHTKFGALFPHNPAEPLVVTKREAYQSASKTTEQVEESVTEQPITVAPAPDDRLRVSAWQEFHVTAQQEDAQERDKTLQEREDRRKEEEKTGVRSGAGYTYDETFNEIGQEDGLQRTIVSTNESRVNNSGDPEPIPQLDGCPYSRPLKRPRLEEEQSFSDQRGLKGGEPSSTLAASQMDGTVAGRIAAPISAIENPDAIDIDMSDDDDATVVPNGNSMQVKPSTAGTAPNGQNGFSQVKTTMRLTTSEDVENGEEGGMHLNPEATSFSLTSSTSQLRKEAGGGPKASSSGSTLKPPAPDFQPDSTAIAGSEGRQAAPGADNSAPTAPAGNEVSEDMRAQLAALSTKFIASQTIEVTAPLPFPDQITNTMTQFLALGKCDLGQEFLQLLDISSMTSPVEKIDRPFKLSYNEEWLAIQRVFASELQLGGAPTDKVSLHRGDTYYREQIEKEQEWIAEHIVKAGKLQIPENFAVTAPIYDPSLQVASDAMPREVTNPQTSAYCELIGIENKFDIPEEERDFRMQQGPRPESERFTEYRNRPRQEGRGNRGGHRGGRGGGRGRGRGRGRGH